MAHGNAKKIGLDHGDLVGKGDDDHINYLTLARHTDEHGFIRMEYLNTTEQVLPSGSLTVVEFDTIVAQEDPNGDFTGNTTTGQITVNNDGLYMIGTSVPLRIASGASRRFVSIALNGQSNGIMSQEGDRTQSGAKGAGGTTIAQLVATDVIMAPVLAAGTTCTVADSSTCNLWILRIG